MKTFLQAVCATVLSVSLCACAVTYRGDAGTATVVDADTGQPLEGVGVAATWSMNIAPTAASAGILLSQGAVTDSKGMFILPAWGPITPPDVPARYLGDARRAALILGEPHIHFFKAGYVFEEINANVSSLAHLSGPDWAGPLNREAWWAGRTIKLKRFQGTTDEYGSMIDGVGLMTVPMARCYWQHYPNIAANILRETERLRTTGGLRGSPRFSGRVTRDYLRGPECQDVDKLLEPYLK